MIQLVSRLFRSNVSAIGVDLGSTSLKLAQVTQSGAGTPPQLVAAASAPIPDELRNNPCGRIDYFTTMLPKLLRGFRGRRVVLGLPASCIHLTRVRVPVMDPIATKQAIMFEASGELPYHPSQAMIRHLIAGEVFHDNELRNEVIVMAARRELVERYLAAAARAGVEVVGVCPEPVAIASSFAPALGYADESSRRQPQNGQSETARAFVDIGGSGSRVYIAQGSKIQFARAVSIGSEQFDTAIAAHLRMPLVDAKRLRIQLSTRPLSTAKDARVEAATEPADPSFAIVLRSGSTSPLASFTEVQMRLAEQACEVPLTKLLKEIDHCRRYYGSTFHTSSLEQIVFVGGVAAQRRLCQTIARGLHVSARTGDPLDGLCDSRRAASIADPEVPRSAWAVAVGLSRGFIQGSQRMQKAA